MRVGDRRITGIAVAGLAAAVLAVYGQVYRYDFVNYDDPKYVSENPVVLRGVTLAGAVWAFTTGEMGNWHPLTWLSHMLDVQLFGPAPGASHLVNVALHLLNTLLLFLVLQRTTRAPGPSLAVAALFGVHPLHVESVAWIAERKDVLSTFAWFLTLWMYSRYVEARSPRWYAASLACFAVGLTAKPMLVSLPFVLLLLDYWPLGRVAWGAVYASKPAGAVPTDAPAARRLRRRNPPAGAIRIMSANAAVVGRQALRPISALIWEKVPFLALALIASALAYAMQRRSGATDQAGQIPIAIRLTNALVAYVTYVAKALWPADLAVLYPYDLAVPAWQPVMAALLLTAASALALVMARRHPYALVGWLWYLGTLVPVIGLVQIGSQALADRYTYVPLVGIFLILAWGGRDLARRWAMPARAMAALTTAAVAVYAAVAWRQVQYWRNSATLFSHAAQVTRDNCIAHNNLGIALAWEGKIDAAAAEYREALRIKPDYADAHANLGRVLARQSRRDDAVVQYRAALAETVRAGDPHGRDLAYAVHGDLGRALAELGRRDEALAELSEAVRLRPESIEAHTNLGNALRDAGQFSSAIEQYRQAVALDPERPEAVYNLGTVLAQSGQLTEAIEQLTRALRLKPDYAEAHNNLGNALLQSGRRDEAIVHYREAVRLKPDYQQAQRALQIVLATDQPAPQ
jgi:Flp pilus assembly protein TadD